MDLLVELRESHKKTFPTSECTWIQTDSHSSEAVALNIIESLYRDEPEAVNKEYWIGEFVR